MTLIKSSFKAQPLISLFFFSLTFPGGLINLLQIPTLDWIDVCAQDHLPEAVVVHPLQTRPLLG